jgi:uncharacterized phage protein gp47/JayE
MLIIHAGDSELVAVDCFECIDAQLDVREKLRHAYKIKGMTSEAKHEIEAAINNLKKEYDIRLDLIEVSQEYNCIQFE